MTRRCMILLVHGRKKLRPSEDVGEVVGNMGI